MAKSYKKSYRSRRGVRRFKIEFSTSALKPKRLRAKVCKDCGDEIEEVMTVPRCFRCEGIRRAKKKMIPLDNMPAEDIIRR